MVEVGQSSEQSPGRTHRTLSEVVAATAPLVLGRERTLPVHEALIPFLAEGALVRGTTVGIGGVGANSLALALASGPSAAGSWVVIVGNDEVGLVAAADMGVALSRLVLVPEPPARSWGQVLATLVESFDVVLAWPRTRFAPKLADRLATRLRTHGAVLVLVDAAGCGLGVDVVLRGVDASWEMAPGSSYLLARRLGVESTGRGRASAPRRGGLWLPGPDGGPAADHERSSVSSPRASGEAVEPARWVDPLEVVHADAG